MRITFGLGCLALIATQAAAQPSTVSVYLDSSRDGQAVSPGTAIDWAVFVSVSPGDNLGLAQLNVNLTQSSGNPSLFDIPPADAGSIDATMSVFDRPAGITLPGADGESSGYVGTPRGVAGAMNLVQIGGAQNTMGEVFAPGSGVAESAIVTPGVGQGAEPQLVVSGVFVAPEAPGVYTFFLSSAVVNVLEAVNAPPQHSPVIAALVDLSSAEISFEVVGDDCPADIDGDGVVGLGDLSIILTHFGTIGGATPEMGDINGDGNVDLADLSLLLEAFGTACE